MEPKGVADEVAQLKARWNFADPWDYDREEVEPLQFQALQSRFRTRRPQLRVLDQRATDQGIVEIGRLQDVIPLLFAHTTYKSYTPSFVSKGRWDLMTRWLGNLTVAPIADVDLSNVMDIDGWVMALRSAGHIVISSSGTTGQSSFISHTIEDQNLHRLSLSKAFEVTTGQTPGNRFQTFFAGPRIGLTMASQQTMLADQLFSAPGGAHYISETGNTIAQLDRMAVLRRAMAAGTATPDMIQNVQAEAEKRASEMRILLVRLLDKILAYRHQPTVMVLLPSMVWQLVQYGREQGIPDGDFHPETIIRTGGGRKGAKLPDNFKDEAEKFIGIGKNRWVESYGMSEISTHFNKCSAGRYHCPPTVIPLVLDKSGEQLLEHGGGIVEGRGGFFDLALEGYWGGIISGDRLTVDFGRCPCGRGSASVMEIERYTDLAEGDDKLTCAGQIDTYVNGFVAEAE